MFTDAGPVHERVYRRMEATRLPRDDRMAQRSLYNAQNILSSCHVAQSAIHYESGFFFHQPRVIDLAGRIVKDHQQMVVPIIGEPEMLSVAARALLVVSLRRTTSGFERLSRSTVLRSPPASPP